MKQKDTPATPINDLKAVCGTYSPQRAGLTRHQMLSRMNDCVLRELPENKRLSFALVEDIICKVAAWSLYKTSACNNVIIINNKKALKCPVRPFSAAHQFQF